MIHEIFLALCTLAALGIIPSGIVLQLNHHGLGKILFFGLVESEVITYIA